MFPYGHHHETEEERRRREEREFPPPGYNGVEHREHYHHQHHQGGPDYSYGSNPHRNPYPHVITQHVAHEPGPGSYHSAGFPSSEHVSHESTPASYSRPLASTFHRNNYDPNANFPSAQHLSHESGRGSYQRSQDRYHEGFPFVQHVSHEISGSDRVPSPEHISHESRPESCPRPLPSTFHRNSYDPNPNFPSAQHLAHELGPGSYQRYPDRHQEGFPRVQHVSHEIAGSDRAPMNRRTVRIFTKANENFSLSIRDGKVVLARSNPNDEYQHWIKDEKFSTRVKDKEGCPSFALINKVTGEAIKHSIGATQLVRLIPYNPDVMDESILWTESRDTGEGFRCIRMVNNINLNFDAFHGDEDHGGVHDGTAIVLWEWVKGKNQRWKIVPY